LILVDGVFEDLGKCGSPCNWQGGHLGRVRIWLGYLWVWNIRKMHDLDRSVRSEDCMRSKILSGRIPGSSGIG